MTTIKSCALAAVLVSMTLASLALADEDAEKIEKSLGALRALRGKAGVQRNLPDDVTVTPGHPATIETGEESTYVAIHLKSLVLRNGAALVLRNEEGTEIWRTTEEITAEDVWLPPVPAESARLACENTSASSCDCDVVIDRSARGHDLASLRQQNHPELELSEICGDCNLEDTVCSTLPAPLKNRRKAVARLLLGGTDTCTGFLVGDQGHLITNVHCIANENEARNVTFEFGAEEPVCPPTVNCNQMVKATASRLQRGAVWVGSDATIDVAIVKLPASFAQTFGHLVLAKRLPNPHENVGLVQHPLGQSKKYSIDNVRSVGGPACGDGLPATIGYKADTLEGSSGAPVISLQQGLGNGVIAVHECLGCPNRGIPSLLVAQRLGHLLPQSAFDP